MVRGRRQEIERNAKSAQAEKRQKQQEPAVEGIGRVSDGSSAVSNHKKCRQSAENSQYCPNLRPDSGFSGQNQPCCDRDENKEPVHNFAGEVSGRRKRPRG